MGVVGVERHRLTVSLQEGQRGSTQEGPESLEEAENPPQEQVQRWCPTCTTPSLIGFPKPFVWKENTAQVSCIPSEGLLAFWAELTGQSSLSWGLL